MSKYHQLQSNPAIPIPIPGVPTGLQPVVSDIEAEIENEALSCGQRWAKKLEVDVQHAEDRARAKLRQTAIGQLILAVLVTLVLGFVIVELDHIPATILASVLSLVSLHCGITGVKYTHKHLYLNMDVDVSVKGGITLFKLSNWHPINFLNFGLAFAFVLAYFGVETFLIHDVSSVYSGKQLLVAVLILMLSWFGLVLQIFGIKFASELQSQVNKPAKSAAGARLV
jgi:hypothetical protein